MVAGVNRPPRQRMGEIADARTAFWLQLHLAAGLLPLSGGGAPALVRGWRGLL